MKRLDRRRFRCIAAISGRGVFHERLVEAGIETRVVRMDPLYITVAATNPLRLGALLLTGLWSILCLARLIQEEAVDVVCTNVQGGHVYGGFAARLTGKPMVMYMRDIPQGSFSTRLFPWVAQHLAQRVICISYAVKDFFAGHRRYGARLAQKLKVVHNGIDVHTVTAGPPDGAILQEFGLGEAYPVVTIVGRLQPWKGQREFLQAAVRVREAFPSARFLVVGEVFQFQEGFHEELFAIVRRNNLEHAVTFTGQRTDIPAILSATHIAVSASWHEPFGRVIIEAMAMARPVVGTRAGAIPEIVADGETGVLIPVRDHDALADAIIAVAGNRQDATRMGQCGRQRVEAHFTIEATVENAAAVFESA